jgi:hypothetical protein
MGSLLLPSRVAEEELAARIDAEAAQQVQESKLLLNELKAIDPTLTLVLVSEFADPQEYDYPGCWYLKKRIPDGPDEYFPLVDVETGRKLDPGLWVLDWLQAADLWNPRVHRSKKEAKEKLRTSRTRAKKLRAEQRQDEMGVAYRAANRVRGEGGMARRTDRKGIRPERGIVLPAGVDAT